METCHYDTGHWPCGNCQAKSPDSEDACCKYPEKEEKLVCPLCGQQVNVEVELADAIIRIMDAVRARGWRVAEAIVAKHEYNKTRPFKHGGKEF